jgi:hypothetical protein
MHYLYVYGRLGTQHRLCGLLSIKASDEAIDAACNAVESRGYSHPFVTTWAGDKVRPERS